MTFLHQLLVNLLYLFVKVGSARIQLHTKVLVVICLQVIEVYALGELFLTAFVKVRVILVMIVKLLRQKFIVEFVVIIKVEARVVNVIIVVVSLGHLTSLVVRVKPLLLTKKLSFPRLLPASLQ